MSAANSRRVRGRHKTRGRTPSPAFASLRHPLPQGERGRRNAFAGTTGAVIVHLALRPFRFPPADPRYSAMTSQSPDMKLSLQTPVRAPSAVPVDDAALPFEVSA